MSPIFFNFYIDEKYFFLLLYYDLYVKIGSSDFVLMSRIKTLYGFIICVIIFQLIALTQTDIKKIVTRLTYVSFLHEFLPLYRRIPAVPAHLDRLLCSGKKLKRLFFFRSLRSLGVARASRCRAPGICNGLVLG